VISTGMLPRQGKEEARATASAARFERDGFLVLPGLVPATECDDLRARMADLVAAFWSRNPDNWLRPAALMPFRGFLKDEGGRRLLASGRSAA
jgi:hypothetical protein